MKRHAKTHHPDTNVSDGAPRSQTPLNRVPLGHVHPPPADDDRVHHHDTGICGDVHIAGNEVRVDDEDESEGDGENGSEKSGGEEDDEEEAAEDEDEG